MSAWPPPVLCHAPPCTSFWSHLVFSEVVRASTHSSLMDVYAGLHSKRFVDLTHAFAPGIPHWPGFPDEKRETLYGYDKGQGSMGSGFLAERYSHVGQWGTDVDPPAHFAKGLRT